MVEIAERTKIACPPVDVWAALADFDAIAQWAPNVDHSCLTTDIRTGVGSERRVQVGRNSLLERVTEWEPGVRLSYAITGLPPVVRSAVNTWSLDGDDSATTVTLLNRVDTGPRPPQQLVARVFGRVMAKASVQMLGGLKTYLEEGRA